MKKGIFKSARPALLTLLVLQMTPLLLLMLSMGAANIESVRAVCATPSSGGSMGIGTLNWRGASHYKRNPRPGERPYHERVPNMVAKINNSGTSIIGFQEFEPPQAQAFLKATNRNWAIVKGKDGSGMASTANAIAYQRSAWKLDEIRYVSIHYGRPKIKIPLARFTSTAGLGSVWVLNTHNPAGAVGGTSAMRNDAVRSEARALAKLQAADPNTALFLTGDMNDAAGFKRLFLSAVPGWSAANPSNRGIDWIMGSPTVTFSNPVVDQSTNDNAHKYTDHPFVHTSVQLAGTTTDQSGANSDSASAVTRTGALQNLAASGDIDAAKVAAEAASKAGFRGEDLVTAVAIARVESSWNSKATNGTHYGLWQISAQHKGNVPGWNAPADIFDPLLNAKYAFALYSARPGSGEAKFADWIPFEKTDYHQYLDGARRAVAAVGGDSTNVSTTGCTTGTDEDGGVSGDRLNRLRQRAEMVIKLAQRYSSPCSVPGFDCQGVGFSGWANACTAISMMVYGNSYVGPGDGGERAYGSVVQGQQGSSWPPPPGAIVSWPYSGSGHVAIYLGEGDWVDNWGPVGHHAHEQVEKGATAHWLLPPAGFEGAFLNSGFSTSSS